ncbi:DedA family protein [Rickettsiales bacterium]|nr:DedA family protein [Rickettsiales bacterium]
MLTSLAMNNISELLYLFIISFLAATILPAQSEFAVAGLKIAGNNNSLALIIIATTGNVLGALANWFLGRYLIHFKDRKWFPVKEKMINKATNFYQKWGIWSLLLAWAPFIGDPLTLVAGILRANIWIFLLLVTIGKATRYAIIVLAV